MTAPIDIILLHGAGGQRDELLPVAQAMGDGARWWSLDLLGHNGRPTPQRYGVKEIADDLMAGLDKAGVGPAYFFGYSFGGYIGLYIARYFPDRVRGLITLATKFVYDPVTVRRTLHVLDPRRAAYMRLAVEPWVAEVHKHHRALLEGVAETGPPLDAGDLQAIAPMLALNGDADTMVHARETKWLAAQVEGSSAVIFPGRAHPLRAVPLDFVAAESWTYIRGREGARVPLPMPHQSVSADPLIH